MLQEESHYVEVYTLTGFSKFSRKSANTEPNGLRRMRSDLHARLASLSGVIGWCAGIACVRGALELTPVCAVRLDTERAASGLASVGTPHKGAGRG